MAVSASDLVIYGSANRPDDDTSTTGGAIDTAARYLTTQLTTNDTLSIVSDGTDTRNFTVYGVDSTGSTTSEGPTALTSTTPVVTSTTWQYIDRITLASTDGSRTVTVSDGDAGQGTLGTIGINEDELFTLFVNSATSTATVTRWEKVFAKNTNATDTLNNAVVILQADPSSKIRIALDTTKGASTSAANRETTPTPIGTIYDNLAEAAVPTGALAAGDTIGIWVEQQLLSTDSSFQSYCTLRVKGTTV